MIEKIKGNKLYAFCAYCGNPLYIVFVNRKRTKVTVTPCVHCMAGEGQLEGGTQCLKS